MHVLLAVVGGLLVVGTWISVVSTLVVPRHSRGRIGLAVLGATDGAYRLLTARVHGYPRQRAPVHRRLPARRPRLRPGRRAPADQRGVPGGTGDAPVTPLRPPNRTPTPFEEN